MWIQQTNNGQSSQPTTTTVSHIHIPTMYVHTWKGVQTQSYQTLIQGTTQGTSQHGDN